MANRDQHRTTRRRSSPDYRSTQTSGVNSSAGLVACSGTWPGALKRSTRPGAGSANTAITSRNKLGIFCRPDNSSNSPIGFACVSKSAATIGGCDANARTDSDLNESDRTFSSAISRQDVNLKTLGMKRHPFQPREKSRLN